MNDLRENTVGSARHLARICANNRKAGDLILSTRWRWCTDTDRDARGTV